MTGILRRFFKPQTQSAITIVSGLPRSGTSMMMKMLDAGGIPPLTDEIRTADTDNPKGYYEYERVKQLDKGDTDWLPEAQGKAVKVISALLKHLPSDYEYRVIFMRRNMSEILASQRKMLVHRGESSSELDDEKMAKLFDKHLQAVEQWLQAQDNVAVLDVYYSDILENPRSQLSRLNEFLGGDLNMSAMTGVIDPDLYRNREEELEPPGARAA